MSADIDAAREAVHAAIADFYAAVLGGQGILGAYHVIASGTAFSNGADVVTPTVEDYSGTHLELAALTLLAHEDAKGRLRNA